MDQEFKDKAMTCFESDVACPDTLSECFQRADSICGNRVSSRYDNASAGWVVYCAILMFFMKAGFLFLEESFCKSNNVSTRRRVVLAKYIDIFAGTFGFWLFGYAVSANTDAPGLGENQDFIFWFFRFTFASNTATILGGTLVGHDVQLRITAIFVYSFMMTAFIHPGLARFFWSVDSSDPPGMTWSPFAYCNGTFTLTEAHEFTQRTKELGGFVFIDFAGSGLVHLCGGIGGLVLAIFHKLETSDNKKIKLIRECGNCNKLLARTESKKFVVTNTDTMRERPEEAKKPDGFLEQMYPNGGGDEDVSSAALGILILWTTWFAFNSGSTESISGKNIHSAVGRIALVMCLSCASAGTVQVLVSALVQIYKRDECFNTNIIASAVLGALVAVTGCCPFIEPWFAVIIGALTVGVYHFGCYVEYLLGIHDSARVFPVHGMCGFWGILCVGIFSRSCLIREIYDDLCFCIFSELPETIENRGLLFGYQLAGGMFIAVWSFVLCSILFLVLFYFPVNFVLACLPKVVFCQDKSKGEIRFTGNILFTHFDEIGGPNPIDDEHQHDIRRRHSTEHIEMTIN